MKKKQESVDYSSVETTVGHDLLAALVAEIKLLQKPWEKCSQREQQDVIDRLRSAVEESVTAAVIKIAAAERPTLAAEVDSVTFKDGVKAVVKMNKHDAARHELADAQGQTVLIVVAAPKTHTEGMDSIQGEADQRALGLNEEYTDA